VDARVQKSNEGRGQWTSLYLFRRTFKRNVPAKECSIASVLDKVHRDVTDTM
jgi:hypothetical protein